METGVRARSSQQRQQTILDAALDLLLEKGFGATTLDQILEQSGASVGSFYHHFKNKLEVAAALYLTILESYQQAFVTELRKHRDARAGIEGGVRHHLNWTASNHKAAAYLTHCREPEVAEASEARAQELNRAFFEQVIGWLATHIRAKTIRSLPIELYHPLWIGPADEFARYWLADSLSQKQLLRAERVLAPAAWEALREHG
jgi:AcrR family transcriptional regulator